MNRAAAILIALAGGAVACAEATEVPAPDASVVFGDALPRPDAVVPDAAADADADVGLAMDMGFVDAGTVCDEAAVAVLTATTVADRAAMLDGAVVRLVGVLVAGDRSCNKRACPPDDPCCNDCTAPLFFGPAEVVSSACAADVGCRGTECLLVCTPPAIGFEQRYRAVVRAGPPLQLELIATE